MSTPTRNGGSFDPQTLPTLVEILRRRAALQGGELAFRFLADGEREEQTFTYAELDRRARAVATLLSEMGAEGERVLLLYPASLDYVAAFFGCLVAGAVAVPAYPPRPNRPMPRLAAIAADAHPLVALTTQGVFDGLEKRLAGLADLERVAWRVTDSLPDPGDEAWQGPAIDRDRLAFLQYTSGSTSTPKGVMVRHGNLMHNEELIRRACEHTASTPCVSWLPLYHDLGLIGNLLQSLYVGSPCTLMSPVAFLQRPLRWLAAISSYRAHTSGGPNFAYELAVAKTTPEERAGLDLSSWRVAFNGAEPVRHDTLERFARAFAPHGFNSKALFPCYGLAETTLIVAAGSPREDHVSRPFDPAALGQNLAHEVPPGGIGRRLVSSGRVLGDLALTIVEPETGRELGNGEIGEIWVAGGSIAAGYWNRPEATAETFDATTNSGLGPYLRTGDLGFLDRGELFIAGRLKDLLILRGTNHYPQDLEATVERSHPALRAGASAAFAVEVGGEEKLVVVAEVERSERGTPIAEIVDRAARAVLEEHEVALFALTLLRPGAIAKTTSGKIQRRQNRADWLEGRLEVLAAWRQEGAPAHFAPTPAAAPTPAPVEPAPATSRLALLHREAAAVLGRKPEAIEVGTSLLAYGLDSLKAIELAHAVERRAGFVVPLERLLEGPSLAELASELDGAGDARPAAARPAAAGALTEEPEFPLSEGQRALWFLAQLEPGSAAYHMPSAVRITSPVDLGALERAAARLVARHPAIRTRFVVQPSGEPVARVTPAAEASLAFSREDAAGGSLGTLYRRLEEEATRPFDLEQGPLFRLSLFERGAAEPVLLVAMHHIVADFWSLAVMVRELGALYGEETTGRPAELPPPGDSCAAFARRQARELAGEEGARLAAFWRRELGAAPTTLDLPWDRPRPPVRTSAGDSVRFEPPASLAQAVAALAAQRRVTPFTLLLSAFETLLHRLSHQPEVVVGVPAAGRRQASLAGVVGYFVNPICLAARFSPTETFNSLLTANGLRVRNAFAHQDYPFSRLVADLAPARDASRSPLFQVMFAYQAAPSRDDEALAAFALRRDGARLTAGDLELALLELPERRAQFDLTLTLAEFQQGAGPELGGTLDFSTELFDRATATRLARQLGVLLAAVVERPEAPVAEISLLSAQERRQLLVEWNSTDRPLSPHTTVFGLFRDAAERHPDALAVTAGETSLSFGALRRRAHALAHTLREAGAQPEQVVGLLAGRSPNLLVGLLAILEAGAAYLPLDPEAPAERRRQLLADARVELVLTDTAAETDWPADSKRLDLQAPPRRQDSPLPPPPHATSAACVIYTSGSTGAPKGVVIEHGGLLNLVESFFHCYQPGPGDAILPMTSVAYASFTGEVLPMLAAGARVVLPLAAELLDAGETARLIARQGVTILSAVPAVIAALNAQAQSAQALYAQAHEARARNGRAEEVPKLRLILSGGEALSAGNIDRLLGTATLVNGYGLTETTICSTVYWLRRADLHAGRQIPIGKPIQNTRLYVLDRRFEPQPIGSAGELFVGGAGLARGFLAAPALTAARFVPNPFGDGERLYKTGDLARLRADGQLMFEGRSDRQIKVRGFRIELGEIEAVLARHERVREAAVLLLEPAPGAREARLVAFVVVAPGGDGRAELAATELSAWLRRFLPAAMTPSAYLSLEHLPQNAHGKRDLKALAALAPAAAELDRPFTPPRGELERKIATLWQEVLGRDRVGIHDNFFDLGGHSLALARLHARLRESLGEVARDLTLVDLFRLPTIAALAGSLAGELAGEKKEARPRPENSAVAPSGSRDLAIIALSGRFPGAENVDAWWRNLAAGVESIHRFSDEELLAEGIDPELVANPSYIKAKGILGGVELFDAGFFGFSPRGAELTDPQHRVFLECAYEALELAGYDPERYPGRIGVFAGQSMNTYWLNNLYWHIDLVASLDSLQAAIGNDKDSLTTEVSYRLNLRGPSVLVQSSSSTSLTAVHYAAQSILAGECEMALAGGVSIHVPEVSGYLYHEGGTTDPTGHCRTFDAEAKGFVSGHGAGVVVLKRLEAALADGDRVLAVLKGSACNNDGSFKVSYMAPSVDGHADVVVAAQQAAGVSPETITYLEAHGTGTLLGDPIEVAALTQAFRRGTERRGFCALGSAKTNIGHLDSAAGVAGLIKTTLSLHHRTLLPLLHFHEPNPKIDFETSPFYVQTELAPWPASPDAPRRAGVSSLGMGGTNTHVILEEAPERPPSGRSRRHQLLRLSAKTATALEAVTDRLAAHLADHPEEPLSDVAFTLAAGRRPYPFRRVVVGENATELAALLAERSPGRVFSGPAEAGHAEVVFLFSGQGSQYAGMGRGLYAAEPVYRAEIDRAAELLLPTLGLDLRDLLDPAPGEEEEAARRLAATEITQPALFAVEHALARLLVSWGIEPVAMLGHSIGEYVAASLAGVFSFEDALTLVAERGRLMASLPKGSMLAVSLGEAELAARLPAGLDIAALNRPDITVVAGPSPEIEAFAAELAGAGIEARPLITSHAFHSRMMEPILETFRARVAKVTLSPPRLPMISNLSGTWLRPEEATDPTYWARHLRGTVRFAAGVATLLGTDTVLLEIGPGHALTTAARQVVAVRQVAAAQPGKEKTRLAVLSTLRHPREAGDDQAFLLTTLGRLWLAGVSVDAVKPQGAGFWAGEARRRLALPTYPFERQRYWVEPGAPAGLMKKRGARQGAHCLQLPLWRQAPRPTPAASALSEAVRGAGPWLVLADNQGHGTALAARLAELGAPAATVWAGSGFERVGEGRFEVDPERPDDWRNLRRELAEQGRLPRRVVHLWSMSRADGEPLASALRLGHESLLGFARAMSDLPWDLSMVVPGVSPVSGGETLRPAWATALGAVRALPQELPQADLRLLDFDRPETAADLDTLLAEAARGSRQPEDFFVAWRHGVRFVQGYGEVPADLAESRPAPLKEGGVYVVTGGFGGLGLALAEDLARTLNARLVLVGRQVRPERLAALEALGAEVLALAADVTDRGALEEVKVRTLVRFGRIDGVIHAAGLAGGALAAVREAAQGRAVLAPKTLGTENLLKVFADTPLDFIALFASTSGLLSELGQADYAAANAYLDAVAQAAAQGSSGHRVVALDWDAWREAGMALSTAVPEELRAVRAASLALGFSNREGAELFRLALATGLPQVAISKRPLEAELARGYSERAMALLAAAPAATHSSAHHGRPDLASPYEAPRTETESRLAALWSELLGLDGVGIHDSFFELGGNSLIGLKVMSRVNKTFGVELPMVELFDRPTIAQLAKALAPEAEEPAETYALRRSRGARRRERLRGRGEVAE